MVKRTGHHDANQMQTVNEVDRSMQHHIDLIPYIRNIWTDPYRCDGYRSFLQNKVSARLWDGLQL